MCSVAPNSSPLPAKRPPLLRMAIDINELTALLSAVELGYVVLLSDAIDACILSIYPFKQELKISTANSGTGLLPLIVSKNFPSTTFFILDF